MYESFKCPCIKFSESEFETSGRRSDKVIDFNLCFLDIIGWWEEVLARPTPKDESNSYKMSNALFQFTNASCYVT
jgi:hypothetical protein